MHVGLSFPVPALRLPEPRAALPRLCPLVYFPPVTPQNIRRLRLALGYDRKRFAAFLRVSVPTVARWESGVRRPDRGHTLALQLLWANHRLYRRLTG